jgi:hypothetical protein
MDQLRIAEFSRLLTPISFPCVSIFFPTTPGGVDARGDRLRLKNGVEDADTRLAEMAVDKSTIEATLDPARKLLDDDAFWRETERGLAVWLSPLEQYWLKSQFAFRDSVTVGDRFRIRALAPLWGMEAVGFVLALSQDHVRLYRVTPRQCELQSVPNLPTNLREALNEISVDRGAQCHTVGRSAKRKQTAVFHAQGAGHDTEKTDLGEYCRQIAKAVSAYLDPAKAPLLLACVEYLAPVYREANQYATLLPEVIPGNPDYLTNQQVVDFAWPIFQSHFDREVSRQLARFQDLRGTERSIADTAGIVSAALEGRVDQLFFDDRQDIWGRYDDAYGVVDVHDVPASTDVELVDLAVAATLRHRGNVRAIDPDRLPAPTPMAAILRNVPAAKPAIAAR